MSNILGGAYSGANDLLQVHEKMGKGDADSATFRLLLLLNQVDIKLLHASVEQMTKYESCQQCDCYVDHT